MIPEANTMTFVSVFLPPDIVLNIFSLPDMSYFFFSFQTDVVVYLQSSTSEGQELVSTHGLLHTLPKDGLAW